MVSNTSEIEAVASVRALLKDAEEIGFVDLHNIAWTDRAPLTVGDLRALLTLSSEIERKDEALREIAREQTDRTARQAADYFQHIAREALSPRLSSGG